MMMMMIMMMNLFSICPTYSVNHRWGPCIMDPTIQVHLHIDEIIGSSVTHGPNFYAILVRF